MIEITHPNPFSRIQMISSWRRTRRWLSPYPPGRSQMASLSFRIHVKWRGVIPSAHFPRSFGGISGSGLRGASSAALRELMLLRPMYDGESLPGALDAATARQFAGLAFATRQRHHALDGGGVGRVAVDREPHGKG